MRILITALYDDVTFCVHCIQAIARMINLIKEHARTYTHVCTHFLVLGFD